MNFDIEEIKRRMYVKYGFFGSVLANVNYKENNDIPTAATDGKNIYYNSKFLNGLDSDQQTFVFAHEVCHIAFDHITKSEGKNPNIWNIATDGVINQLLKRDGLKMVKGAVDIPEAINYDSEQLYEKLLKEQKDSNKNNESNQQENNQQNNSNKKNSSNNQSSQNNQGNSSQNNNQNEDNQKDSQSSQNQNGQGNSSQNNNQSEDNQENNQSSQNQSGQRTSIQNDKQNEDEQEQDSSSKNQNGQSDSSQNNNDSKEVEEENKDKGNSSEEKDEKKDKNGNEDSSKDKEKDSDENKEDSENKDVGHDTHNMWKDALKKQKEEKNKKLQDEIDKISKMGEKKAFKKHLENKRKELEKLKEMLSQQAMGAGNYSTGAQRVVNEIGKSKPIIDWRYVLREAIKYDVDWSYKNAYIEDGVLSATLEEQPMPETEIVLDTSGSIDETLLRNFLRECKNILQHSRLKVGCFDTEFYGFHEIRREEDIENMEFQGGGGTDFNVAVRAFTRRVENKIIFTDGIADMPDIPMDAIWIVFGENKINPKGGRVILIDGEQLDRLYSDESGYSYKRKNNNYI